ncbi:hypothetical protein ACCAA_200061 [Candidatus Accumulibacter aalborgensis]|uniref:Uncharacterized protein n=1 Tax=Candidatus Accumulibacter aalborgensis TaxID=1860102 RepID=A0A1A8XMW9_9PROT|nr:hypothetical protein [Candidatus Accumulibacter aalborgensis]SBT05293.1 hypothetical protein ACCAA_200061 [Candidatus Accumulibacter aalborgensis]
MSAALTPPNRSQLPDADMQAVPVALARAAQRAREIAIHTGTPLVVTRDGRLIEVVQPELAKPMDGVSPKY